VLFEHGAFTAVDANATSSMLAALALGLPAYVLIKVLHPSFFAREDTKTPMLYAGISMAANAVLSGLLFVFLGATGIAVAATLAGWLKVALLIAKLKERGEFALDDRFRRTFPRIAAACALMACVVWGLALLLDPWFAPEQGLAVQGAALLFLVASGLAAFALAAELLGAVRLKVLLANLRGHQAA
jgi:putative peptidoglycan lipid II flippase